MKNINILEDVLIVGGISISITMIQSILGIVIMSVQVILILFKGYIKIRDAIKNKKNVDEITQIIDDTKDQIETLSEKDKDVK